MKNKLYLLVITILFFCFTAKAQHVADKNFASVLNNVINDYHNNFKDMKGDSISDYNFMGNSWRSKENLPGYEGAWLEIDTIMKQITWETRIIETADSSEAFKKYHEVSGKIDAVRFDCGILTRKESSGKILIETREINWSYPGNDNKYEGLDLCLIIDYPISLPGEYTLTFRIEKALTSSDEKVEIMLLPPGQEKTDKVKEETKQDQTSENLPDLCEALTSLTKESTSKFEAISGKDMEIPVHFDNKRKESTYKIQDASSCYIEAVTSSTLNWYAEFGSFNTLDEAESKIKSLQSSFSSCMAKLEFNKVPELIPFNYSYYFKESIDGGLRLYNAKFGIYEGKQGYIPFFCVPENASNKTLNNISNEANSSPLGKGLNRLLTESVIDFKNIIGDKSRVDIQTMSLHFPTSFCLPGAIDCEIEQSGITADKGHKSYYAKNISAADADQQIEKLSKNVTDALGKNFVWEQTTDGRRFIQLSKVGIKNSPVIEVDKEEDRGVFNVFIQAIVHFRF